MNNIILIGMPASGKSTAGVILAKTIGYGFLDIDILIQERTGRTLQDIIDGDGIEEFMKIEEQTVLSVDVEKTVIATGGSVVYGEKAMAHLQTIGSIVYLKSSCENIEKRLDNIMTRGVVMKPGRTIRDVYAERVSLYEKYAGVTVDADTDVIERKVEEIIRKLFGGGSPGVDRIGQR